MKEYERELLTAGFVKQPYSESKKNLHGGSCTEIGGQKCSIWPMEKTVRVNGKLLR